MALDGSKIKIAGSGAIWKAPLATTAPSDYASAYGAGWVNLGYLKDGFEVTTDLKTKAIEAWQSLEVVRLINTGLSRKVKFDAIESNNETVKLAWGGATITPGTAGAYTLAVPTSYLTQEFMLGLDVTDGTTGLRIIFKRAALISAPAIKYGRMEEIKYSFEVQSIAPTDGSSPVSYFGQDAGVSA